MVVQPQTVLICLFYQAGATSAWHSLSRRLVCQGYEIMAPCGLFTLHENAQRQGTDK